MELMMSRLGEQAEALRLKNASDNQTGQRREEATRKVSSRAKGRGRYFGAI